MHDSCLYLWILWKSYENVFLTITPAILLHNAKGTVAGWHKNQPLQVSVQRILFFFSPEFSHVLQFFTFCFWHHLPNEYCCNDTYNSIESIGEPVSEVITFLDMHIEHRYESAANYPVEYPLERHSNSNSLTTDGVREYLRNKYPTDRSP